MGVLHRIGIDMSYWIISTFIQLIAEKTVQYVTCDDMLNPYIAAQITAFDHILTECLDNINFIIENLNGFEDEDGGSDLPHWDTQDP